MHNHDFYTLLFRRVLLAPNNDTTNSRVAAWVRGGAWVARGGLGAWCVRLCVVRVYTRSFHLPEKRAGLLGEGDAPF